MESKWKNPEQERFFCWHLLAEKTRSKCDVIPTCYWGMFLLFRIEHTDLVSIFCSWSLSLWLTPGLSKDFRLLVLLCVLFSVMFRWPCILHMSYGVSFSRNVPVTFHLIINFCMPQDFSPIFLSTIVQTGHAKKLNQFDMLAFDWVCHVGAERGNQTWCLTQKILQVSGPQKHHMVFFQREFIPEEDQEMNQYTCKGDTREPRPGNEWGNYIIWCCRCSLGL